MLEFDRDGWVELLKQRQIKLAFFDIDGTLLNGEGQYSTRLATAMAQIQQQGIKTAIASGRPPYAARFLFEELGLLDAGLFFTGAEVFCPRQQQVLLLKTLDKALMLALCSRARLLGVYTEVCTADHLYIGAESVASPIGKVHSQHLRIAPDVAELEQIIERQPVVKLLMAVDETLQPGVLQQLEADFPQLIFAYACLPSQPQWSFVSIIPADACKSQAFDFLLDHHGCRAEEVIAFGDAHSDKVFLSRAGLGVAMGSAKPDVKAVADAVTFSAEQDGVAQVLELLVNH